MYCLSILPPSFIWTKAHITYSTEHLSTPGPSWKSTPWSKYRLYSRWEVRVGVAPLWHPSVLMSVATHLAFFAWCSCVFFSRQPFKECRRVTPAVIPQRVEIWERPFSNCNQVTHPCCCVSPSPNEPKRTRRRPTKDLTHRRENRNLPQPRRELVLLFTKANKIATQNLWIQLAKFKRISSQEVGVNKPFRGGRRRGWGQEGAGDHSAGFVHVWSASFVFLRWQQISVIERGKETPGRRRAVIPMNTKATPLWGVWQKCKQPARKRGRREWSCV